MNTKTQALTQGAMLTAVFAVMLLLNRQTGGLFQELFIFMLPMPLTAYAVRYGAKKSLPVLLAMWCISIFFGTFNTIFYACSQSLVGLIFGSLLYKKLDTTKVMLAVMGASMLASAANLVFYSILFGFDLNNQTTEYSDMMTEVYSQANLTVPETLMNPNFLKQMLIVGYLVVGLIEGFIIFQLTLVVLKRLHITPEKPRPLFEYYPPKVLGVVALALFFGYFCSVYSPVDDAALQSLLQTFGMCGYMYLSFFGFLCVTLYLRKRMRMGKGAAAILSVILFLFIPIVLMAAGFLYSATNLHLRLMEE